MGKNRFSLAFEKQKMLHLNENMLRKCMTCPPLGSAVYLPGFTHSAGLYHFLHVRKGENIERTNPSNVIRLLSTRSTLASGVARFLLLRKDSNQARFWPGACHRNPKTSFQMGTCQNLLNLCPFPFAVLRLWEGPCAIRLHIDESTQGPLCPGLPCTQDAACFCII